MLGRSQRRAPRPPQRAASTCHAVSRSRSRPLLLADSVAGRGPCSLGSGSRAHSASTTCFGLVGLRVLEAWPSSRGTVRRSSAGARSCGHERQHRGSARAALCRIRAVAVENRQSRESSRGSRRYPRPASAVRRHGNAVAIVLDVDEQRQLAGGRDRQRRPESAGRTAASPPSTSADRVARPLLENLCAVNDAPAPIPRSACIARRRRRSLAARCAPPGLG